MKTIKVQPQLNVEHLGIVHSSSFSFFLHFQPLFQTQCMYVQVCNIQFVDVTVFIYTSFNFAILHICQMAVLIHTVLSHPLFPHTYLDIFTQDHFLFCLKKQKQVKCQGGTACCRSAQKYRRHRREVQTDLVKQAPGSQPAIKEGIEATFLCLRPHTLSYLSISLLFY